MLEKLSKKIGFTQTEIKVILFIVVSFLIGIGIKTIKENSTVESKPFDYSKEDSLFNYYKKNAEQNLEKEKGKRNTEKFDSKAEVLDFESDRFAEKEKPALPAEKSIDINTADVATLVSLPGIGEITAQKMIDLRAERGKFESLDELMDVKGIGKSKFNKIKKFLYIKTTF
ncbi:MAG: helix-hairpin-helix domain-containing protein [Ignavibacterium sp.]|nr:MAG: helix-hairpin-helix domain-containing protein [Ignavibacterium sp.]